MSRKSPVFRHTSQSRRTSPRPSRSSLSAIVGTNSRRGDPSANSHLFFSVFGYEFINVRLLADNYAKAGFYCYIPDFFQGDPLPISLLNNIEPPLRDRENLSIVDKAKNAAIVPATFGPWLAKHREGVSLPLIDAFVNTIRMTPGTNKIGAIGFCVSSLFTVCVISPRPKRKETLNAMHDNNILTNSHKNSGVAATQSCKPTAKRKTPPGAPSAV